MAKRKMFRRAKNKIKHWSWYDTLMLVLIVGTGIFIFKSGTMQEFMKMIAQGIFMALFIGLILSQIIKRTKKRR